MICSYLLLSPQICLQVHGFLSATKLSSDKKFVSILFLNYTFKVMFFSIYKNFTVAKAYSITFFMSKYSLDNENLFWSIFAKSSKSLIKLRFIFIEYWEFYKNLSTSEYILIKFSIQTVTRLQFSQFLEVLCCSSSSETIEKLIYLCILFFNFLRVFLIILLLNSVV